MDKKQELERWVRTLASFRAEVESEGKWADEYRAALEATEPWRLYQQAKESRAAKQGLADEAAGHVRTLALELYGETQDKHPSPAVTIRVGKTATVTDELMAKLWAIHHDMPDVLKLDAARISKVALVMPVAGVTIEETATAAISADLSAYLSAYLTE
jgi:hypothetical protein